jgi:hypothetical protein
VAAGPPPPVQDADELLGPVESKQYTSIAFTQRLIAEGVDASVGSIGDAYDNALAETHMASTSPN